MRLSALLPLCAAAALIVAGCQKGHGGSQAPSSSENISGAGATFPQPVYEQWAQDYQGKSGVGVNYQAIGSGGGIKQIEAGTVQFGASDKPLKPDELAKAGLYQFPTVLGGVVPAVNVPGVGAGQLKLTGPVLADIYLGKVLRWDDPEIGALNPGLKLPALPITTVHRSDGSGTNFLFTSYLSGASPAFSAKVGASDSVQWPNGLGGKGNPGVAAYVKQTAGSIGYVEYAYATQNHIPYALLQNKDGHFAPPQAASFAAAAKHADWAHAPGNYLLLLDQPGADTWPITGATFILVHTKQDASQRGGAVLKFFDWAYRNGDAAAAKLEYVPLPASVKDLMRKQWTQQVTGPGGKPVYPSAH